MIEAKGIDAIRLKNVVRVVITSNRDWVIPAGKDDRRFCVLDISDRVAQNHAYFAEMDEELDAGGRAALLADLLAFDLSTVNLPQIPRTAAPPRAEAAISGANRELVARSPDGRDADVKGRELGLRGAD
jgi:hypothetical protein